MKHSVSNAVCVDTAGVRAAAVQRCTHTVQVKVGCVFQVLEAPHWGGGCFCLPISGEINKGKNDVCCSFLSGLSSYIFLMQAARLAASAFSSTHLHCA